MLTGLLLLLAGLAACGALMLRQRRTLTLLRRALQGVDQGLCVLDEQDRVVFWNERLEQLCNLPAGTLRRGQTLERCLDASSTPSNPTGAHGHALAQDLLRLRRRHRRFSSEVELPSGVILHSQSTPLDRRHWLIRYTDVSDIKRAQLAFRDLASRLAATLDNVLDGIITLDDHGIIDSFSSGAEQLFGCSASAVIGTNIRNLIPEVYASLQDEGDAPHASTSGQLRARREVDARCKTGQLIPIEVGTGELRVAGRRLFICVVRDIAERRRIERLQQEFIATVSHELRTPLTCIIGALGLMADTQATPSAPSARLLQIAQQNGERLQRLIDDILDSVKSNIEALDLSYETLPINRLIAATLENNLAFAARFDVRLELDAIGADVVVRVDPSRLQQVLTNLISNAVKCSPAKETVTVSLSRDRASALISVADRGPGIPDNFRGRIFEKFAQADSSDSRSGGGTGLGLYIARKLVTRMGGAIDYRTQQGCGTTFKVVLPLQMDATAQQPQARHLTAMGA